MTGVIIAFPKAEVGKKIKAILVRSGYTVAGVYTSGSQVVQGVGDLDDGIVITSYRLPDMIYRELREDLPPGFRMIALTSPEQWADNGDDGVISLSLPLKVHELLSTLEMEVYNLERVKRRRKKKPAARTPEEQAIIDKAKGILMGRNNMNEAEAHRYLQKTSMDNGTSFTETAQMILSMMDY